MLNSYSILVQQITTPSWRCSPRTVISAHSPQLKSLWRNINAWNFLLLCSLYERRPSTTSRVKPWVTVSFLRCELSWAEQQERSGNPIIIIPPSINDMAIKNYNSSTGIWKSLLLLLFLLLFGFITILSPRHDNQHLSLVLGICILINVLSNSDISILHFSATAFQDYCTNLTTRIRNLIQ